MLEDIEKWSFDMWQFFKVCQSHPLFVMSLALLRRHDLIHNLNMDMEKFEKFVIAVEGKYQDVPYHSSIHAADVLQVRHSK